MNTRIGRRGLLSCTAFAGAGIVWTVSGGVPRMLDIATANAAMPDRLHFAQVSDSHIGFDKDPNHDSTATFQAAIDQIRAMKRRPAFLLHTGDITHLSKEAEFDDARQILSGLRAPVFYVPGEHDYLDEGQGKAFLAHYGKGTQGSGWHSFDHNGVHFVALNNVANLKPGGMAHLGEDQIAWLKKDLAGLSASTPIVVFGHIPLWTVYEVWGWGTDDSAAALEHLRRFGSVTVLNGHIHQILHKVEGNVTFHSARSTAYPQPAPGAASSPGPLKVPTEQLPSMLGIRSARFVPGTAPIALIDSSFA